MKTALSPDTSPELEEARKEFAEVLPKLRQAIIDATDCDSAFWIGEILLDVLKQETGYDGVPTAPVAP